jgi:hypothetical protein
MQKAQSLPKDLVQKLKEELALAGASGASPAGLDWSKIPWQKILDLMQLVIEYFRQPALSGAGAKQAFAKAGCSEEECELVCMIHEQCCRLAEALEQQVQLCDHACKMFHDDEHVPSHEDHETAGRGDASAGKQVP